MPRRTALIAVVLLAALPLLAGCSALLGQRYTNFTAYYNTFYNAQRAFEREERRIQQADPPVDRGAFLPLLPRPAETRGGAAGLDATILKAADILRDHPSSKWVDDALLLIGKSYHYQGNFSAAAQKFREVLQLDGDRLRPEAYLWLGRSLMGAEDYGAAAAALRDGLALESLRPREAAFMQLTLGELDVRRGDYAAGARALEEGIDSADTQIAARAAFLLGQVYDAQGNHEAAARAYGRVMERRPSPELEYAAQLQHGLALGRNGQLEEALARLTRLRRDDKYFQQRAEVDLTRAQVLGPVRPGEARNLLLTLLYDPEPGIRIDQVRGPIHYRLGQIYRDGLRDFARAAAHFDTAATALRQAPVRARLTTAEAITDVVPVAETFSDYARVNTRVAELDSLLHLGGLDEEAFARTIAEIGEQRRQEAIARAREQRRIEEQQGFGGGAAQAQGSRPHGPGAAMAAAAASAAAGFLGYRDPVRVQEAYVAFQVRWGDRPHVPNWRRAEAVSAALAVREELDEERGRGSSAPTVDLMRDVFVDVSAIPRTPEAHLAMRRDRAGARYELGNVLLLSLGEPEEAAAWYERVIREDPDLPVAARAYYALAQTQLALGNEARAESLYRELEGRFPDDPIARAARRHLGYEEEDPDLAVLRQADETYERAFAAWQRGDHAGALPALLELGEHDAPEVAARARLAAGIVYAEWAAADTLALLAPTPAALLHAPADTLVHAPADTLGAIAPVVPDTISTWDDAVLTEGIELAPLADEPALPWVETLYATIEADFPGTPYAERAAFLRETVAERRRAYEAARPAPPAPDDAADPDPETVADPELEPPPVAAADEGVTFDEADLRGDAAIQPEEGGFSWITLETPRPLEAQNRLIAFHNRGYRTALHAVESEGPPTFQVLVGQFPTVEQAEAARASLPIGSDAAVLRVVALDDVSQLQTADDLIGDDFD